MTMEMEMGGGDGGMNENEREGMNGSSRVGGWNLMGKGVCRDTKG